MKVLIIDVNCKQGSTGKIAYETYTYLNSVDGYEAAVCYGRGKKIKEKNIFKFGIDLETYFHAFMTRLTGYTGCFSYFSTKRLIKFIKKYNPDVVHIHELHAYFINVSKILKFLKSRRIKVVHTLHCAFSYTGKCGHHLECDKWKTCCSKCPHLDKYVSTLFFDKTRNMFLSKKKAFSNFDDMTIVTPSKWLGNYVRESFLKEYSIRTIYNGINTDIFYPRDTKKIKDKFPVLEGKKIALAVAPNLMSVEKGGTWILKIAKKLVKKNIMFVLIGVDNVDIEQTENVILLGRTENQNQLAEFYSLADIFVICSEMENFPTTCLEAQCCGTPVCGFDVGGAKETDVLKNNDAFVRYGDIDSLSQYILDSLTKDKIDVSKLAISLYKKERFIKEYLNVYKKGDVL